MMVHLVVDFIHLGRLDVAVLQKGSRILLDGIQSVELAKIREGTLKSSWGLHHSVTESMKEESQDMHLGSRSLMHTALQLSFVLGEPFGKLLLIGLGRRHCKICTGHIKGLPNHLEITNIRMFADAG